MALFAALPVEVAAKDTGISKLFIAAVEDLTTIQPGTAGVISTAHVAATDEGFYEFPLVANKEGQLKTGLVGEFPSQKNTSSITANIVGLSIEQVQQIQAMKGKTLIAIVQDGNCDSPTKWQVGCDCKPATLSKADFDTETNILVIELTSMCSLKKYTASTIPMAA